MQEIFSCYTVYWYTLSGYLRWKIWNELVSRKKEKKKLFTSSLLNTI